MSLSNLLSTLIPVALAAAAYWSPKVRKRRQLRHAADRRLFGTAPVHDRNGKDLLPGEDSLFAQLDQMQSTINTASLLNGQGEKLVKDMAWVRRTLSAHISDAEAHLKAHVDDTDAHK